jgi:hypothetical protein
LIVTFNLMDFPLESLAPHGVEARHPDELFSELLDAASDEFWEGKRDVTDIVRLRGERASGACT